MIPVSCSSVGDVPSGFAPTFCFYCFVFGKDLLIKIRESASRIASDFSFELVHVESIGVGRQLTIRVFIDKPGGVTLDDCSDFSRRLGALLDSDDLIPSQYLLEVSSPGLERTLYSIGDFEKFAGSLAKIKMHAAIDGQKIFRGRILAVEKDTIFFADKARGKVSFTFDNVKSANLEIDLKEELKRSKA